MAEQVDTTLKVVLEVSVRPQAKLNQVANWTSGVEGWAAAKVDELVASYTGSGLVVEDTSYSIAITNRGVDPDLGGERRWTVYPKQTITVTVDDEPAWQAHIDQYYRALQDEIRTQLAAAPVMARMTILGAPYKWHMHLDGVTDETEPDG